MTKLRQDLSIAILGVAAGLLSSSVTLLIARIDSYYSYLSRLQETSFRDYGRVENLWWVPVSIWHIILSVVATLLIHRYLAIRPRSPFLLWQVVGITTLFGWALTFGLVLGIDCILKGNLSSLGNLLESDDVLVVAKYVATAFACNVFYGSVMSASSRQYVEQSESEAC